MRIGIITQWYDPEPGPAGLMGVLARSLAKRGHEVYVLTGFPNYPSGRISHGYRQKKRLAEIIDGVHVLRVPLYPSHDQSALRRILNYLSFGISASIFGVPQLPRLDAVWVNFSPITLSLPLRLLQRIRKTPTVTEVADLWPDTMLVAGLSGAGLVARTGRRFLHRWCNSVYSASDAVVYISEGIGDILESRGVPRHKLRYIPKPADESMSDSVPVSMRDELQIPKNATVLLYAGALGEAQGLESLLDACSMVEDPRFHVLIAGSGTRENDLKDQARAQELSQIQFLGRIPPNRMVDLYATADIAYVSLMSHPLSKTTMPSKTQAILANGLGILCAAEGDVAELVGSHRVGYTALPGDPTSIAQAIRNALAAGPHELAVIGERARKTYTDEFSAARLGSQAENLLLEVSSLEKTGDASLIDSSEHRVSPTDVKRLAQLHRRAFPDFFLSQLGDSFLRQFYRGFINDSTAVVSIFRDSNGSAVGIAVGTTEPHGFFKRLLKRQFLGFVAASFAASVRNPRAIPRLIAAVRYRGDSSGKSDAALLSSICVDPRFSDRGLGKQLLEDWCNRARSMGANAAYLTTDSENNDKVNGFYMKNSWELEDQFTTPNGRKMNRLRRNLLITDPSQEPV